MYPCYNVPVSVCDESADLCVCSMPAGHADAHECVCGGSWLGCCDEPSFAIVRLPGSAGCFTCAHCGDTFIKDRSDEEVLAACDRLFGAVPPEEDRVVVCDDCHKVFVEWCRGEGPCPESCP